MEWLYTSFALAVILFIIVLYKIIRIFQGNDRKFQPKELMEMIGYFTLLFLTCYMIYKEANRAESWQLFGSTYILFIVGGLLALVGLKDLVLKVVDLLKNNKQNKE